MYKSLGSKRSRLIKENNKTGNMFISHHKLFSRVCLPHIHPQIYADETVMIFARHESYT